MRFNPFHLINFQASDGAFSRVTDREYYDSQITLTDVEADIVISHFGPRNIHTGGVYTNKTLSKKQFLLYPDFTPINLNIVFPKIGKTELRLYLSDRSGFKPEKDKIWFIYKRGNDLVIGALDERSWLLLGQQDYEDNEYQSAIEKTILVRPLIKKPKEGRIIPKTITTNTFYRDPVFAVMRFSESRYRCEVDEKHNTFISQSTKLPYVEAHHFIPIKFQESFKEPLDNIDNIFSLCPNCHRAIHFAIMDYKYDLLKKLYSKRPEINKYNFDMIRQFYNCIVIPRS